MNLRSLDGLVDLAAIAERTGSWFVLRGSVARELVRISSPQFQDSHRVRTFFDLVPPISDIDIVCEDDHRRVLLYEFQNSLPVAGFFHWELRSPKEAREPFAYQPNFQIQAEKTVLFCPRGKSAPKEVEPTIRIELDKANGITVHKTRAKSLRIKRFHTDLQLSSSLRDLAYLARLGLSSRQKDETRELVEGLKLMGGAVFFRELHQNTQEFKRTKFALLKYVLWRKVPALQHSDLAVILPQTFWDQLMVASSDPIFSRLIMLIRGKLETRIKAVIGYGSKNGKNGILELMTRGGDEQEIEADFFSDETELKALMSPDRMSPVFRLGVSHADDGCCAYRDFADGIIETVWTGQRAPKTSYESLLSLVKTPFQSSVSFIHSYLHLGNVSSSRIDRGFLNLIAGRAKYSDVSTPWRELPK